VSRWLRSDAQLEVVGVEPIAVPAMHLLVWAQAPTTIDSRDCAA
jgi:hypothetical protein